MHLFDPHGDPRLSVELPRSFASALLAYDGERVVLLVDASLRIVDAQGKLSGATQLWPEACWPAFSPDGELWVFGDRAPVRRYHVR